MNLRKPTYEEFTELMQKALAHEYSNYRPHVPQERVKWMCENEPDDLWENGADALCTEDGKNIVVTMPNKDGSKYLYSVFVDAGQRNNGIGTALIRHVLESSPKGVSLHVHSLDKDAYRLYERLGFKPFGMTINKAIFMATKKGLPGKDEWGHD